MVSHNHSAAAAAAVPMFCDTLPAGGNCTHPAPAQVWSSDIVRALRQCAIPAICILGVAGNLLTIIVLTRRRVRKSVESQEKVAFAGLLSLAISDALFCIMVFPRVFISDQTVLFPLGDVRLVYQLYSTGLVTTFSLTSTWLIVVMAVFRYIAVCHPFHLKEVVRTNRAYILILVVLLVCILGNLPTFWQYKAMPIKWKGQEMILVDLGQFSHTTRKGLIYQWIKAVFGIFIPFIVLTACNICLILALRESARMRRECSSAVAPSTASKQMTLTLITIVVMFLLLVCPSDFMDFCTHLVLADVGEPESFMVVRAFANVLQMVNFAFNFVLYCVLNAHFRNVVTDFVACSARRQQPRQYTVVYRATRQSHNELTMSEELKGLGMDTTLALKQYPGPLEDVD